MEIVEEVRTIRGNYSAEFGTGGGSQFNVITKTGTNRWHGSAYEFLRNSMNARSYFQPTLPVLKVSEFGFTVGGTGDSSQDLQRQGTRPSSSAMAIGFRCARRLSFSRSCRSGLSHGRFQRAR